MKVRTKVFSGSLMMFILLWFSSCLPDPLEVENIPKLQPRVVVSAQVVPDKYIIILLTKSIGALDASDDSDLLDLLEQIVVNDAVVSIESDIGSDTLKFLGNGLYVSNQIPFSANKQYRLYVNSITLGNVEAVTEVKEQVIFSSVNTRLIYNGYDTVAEVDYSFKDLPGMNWYMINAQRLSLKNLEETVLNPWATTFLFSDEGFENDTFEGNFKVISRSFSAGDTIMVSLSNISEEYYNFMKLRRDNRFSYTNFLGEPINYPTNIKGGYGFFNLYIPDARLFIPKE